MPEASTPMQICTSQAVSWFARRAAQCMSAASGAGPMRPMAQSLRYVLRAIASRTERLRTWFVSTTFLKNSAQS